MSQSKFSKNLKNLQLNVEILKLTMLLLNQHDKQYAEHIKHRIKQLEIYKKYPHHKIMFR